VAERCFFGHFVCLFVVAVVFIGIANPAKAADSQTTSLFTPRIVWFAISFASRIDTLFFKNEFRMSEGTESSCLFESLGDEGNDGEHLVIGRVMNLHRHPFRILGDDRPEASVPRRRPRTDAHSAIMLRMCTCGRRHRGRILPGPVPSFCGMSPEDESVMCRVIRGGEKFS